jgi:hypothetical protein
MQDIQIALPEPSIPLTLLVVESARLVRCERSSLNDYVHIVLYRARSNNHCGGDARYVDRRRSGVAHENDGMLLALVPSAIHSLDL